MSIELVLVVGAGAIAGFALAPLMLRRAAVEEMGIIVSEGSTASFLSGGWGEDEFPEFFASGWGKDDREFYRRLSHALAGARYGRSRKMILKLIRIEDERLAAKSADAQARPKGGAAIEGRDADRAYLVRILSVLDSYKRGGGFESVLAAFIEKRYMERKDGTGG